MEKVEDISFEQYIEKNKDLLIREYKNFKKEDFVIIKARNPDDPKHIIELNFSKYQYESIKKDSKEFGVPFEELAFIAIMETLKESEIASEEEKRQIRSFIDRQMLRIKNNVNKILIENINNKAV